VDDDTVHVQVAPAVAVVGSVVARIGAIGLRQTKKPPEIRGDLEGAVGESAGAGYARGALGFTYHPS